MVFRNDLDLKLGLEASPETCTHTQYCRVHASLRSFLRMLLCTGALRVPQAFHASVQDCMRVAEVPVACTGVLLVSPVGAQAREGDKYDGLQQ